MTSNSLDSGYRRRWELYTTEKGVYDSREINYKQIEEEVIQIETHMEGKVYTVNKSDHICNGLIRWRFGGHHWVDNKYTKIDEWCIGWYDDEFCHMQCIQFKDGSMREEKFLLSEYKSHLG